GARAPVPRRLRPLLPRAAIRPQRQPRALRRPAGEPPAPPRVLHLTTDARHAGMRLDEVAREWLERELGAPPARAAIRRLVMAGAIRTRGHPLRAPGRVVTAGVPLTLVLRTELVRRAAAPETLDPA